MRLLDLSAISTGVAFPFKKGTGVFLQDAYKELFAELLIARLGSTYSTSTPYVIYGCFVDSSGGNTSITKGAVFFNGEVLLSPAQTIADPVGPDILISNILTTQYTTDADPVTFSDTVPRDVHNIRTVEYAAGLTNTGTLANVSAFVSMDVWTSNTLNLSVTAVVGGGSINTGSGTDVIVNKYKIIGKTIHWQISITNATISGTVTEILLSSTIPNPDFIFFKDIGLVKFLGLYNNTPNISVKLGSSSYGLGGFAGLIVNKLDGSAFTTGTNDQNFDINIYGEIL